MLAVTPSSHDFSAALAGVGTLSEGFRRFVTLPPDLIGYCQRNNRSDHRQMGRVRQSIRHHRVARVELDCLGFFQEGFPARKSSSAPRSQRRGDGRLRPLPVTGWQRFRSPVIALFSCEGSSRARGFDSRLCLPGRSKGRRRTAFDGGFGHRITRMFAAQGFLT